jgi:alkanesulfonate monooxygenase SsuD/methylene tetrahydromethanopterin reductase-like flavin-dependent oxidoreductase (luciferase family)
VTDIHNRDRPAGATDVDSRNWQSEPSDITVGLRVPYELPGGAAGLRDFVARAEATGIDRLFTGDHVMFKGGRGFDGLLNATAGRIGKYAAEAGRAVAGWEHGMHVWCGLGTRASAARARLAAVMEAFYHTPFGQFDRYCPCGTPAEVAAALRPYADAGCRSFNLIPVADTDRAAIEGADAVRTALREEHR